MLDREREELLNWKTAYERGHGMQEMARHAQKMKVIVLSLTVHMMLILACTR